MLRRRKSISQFAFLSGPQVYRSHQYTQRGAAALEFAIVGPIFLALLLSIFEAGIFYFVSATVDTATKQAARLVRTGQAQDGLTREDFFNRVCDIVKTFGNCQKKLTVEVTRFNSFDALSKDNSTPTCRDADEEAVGNIGYQTGGRREIVRVRVCYLQPVLTPGLGLNLNHTNNGEARLISTMIFRNEPFQE